MTEKRRNIRQLSSEEARPILDLFAERAKKERLRTARYGRIKPIISHNDRGRRLIAIGDRVLWSTRWPTFPDFLLDYAVEALGVEWGKQELEKEPGERHIIIRWRDHVNATIKSKEDQEDSLIALHPDGIFKSYLLLLYDLYVLRNHMLLQEKVLSRLKNHEQFQGARYELFVTATLIRAGFGIEFEDESNNSSKHVEFVAVDNASGQRIAFEAKSTHRDGVLGTEGQRKPISNMKVARNRSINHALSKPTSDPYVLFVDVNLPPEYEQTRGNEWMREAEKMLTKKIHKMREQFPLNFAVFTNIPHHYDKYDRGTSSESVLVIPISDPLRPLQHPDSFDKVLTAINQYGAVPNHFPD